MESISTRFWRQVNKHGPKMPHMRSNCWLWKGQLDTNKYGRFVINGKRVKANRAAYQITRGSIPDGLCALHRCDNPPCVRPSHLWAGTQAENMRDMIKKGRNSNQNYTKTHCIQGHKLSGWNLMLRESKIKTIRRQCRQCAYNRIREKRQQLKESRIANETKKI